MRKRILAKAKHLKISRKDNRYIMEGGDWGPHSLRERAYTERVNIHWEGYMENNSVKWEGHPEYFPHIGGRRE